MHKTDTHLYEFGAFQLDAAERLLLRDGAVVPLTPKAFDVLLALVEQPGKLLEKEMLLHAVWPDSFVEEKNLADNVFKLRKALGEGENGQKFIETIPKRGYRFVAAVHTYQPEAITTNDGMPVAPPIRSEEAQLSAANVSPSGSRIKRYKQAAVALLLTALAISGYWFWTRAGWRTAGVPATAAAPPALKIRPFTALPGLERWPSFSSDGNQLAFAWGGEKNENFDIYVNFVAGGTPLRLTSTPAQDSYPVWFPDGRSLAFIRQTADDEGIFRIPALGGPEQELLSARTAGLTNLTGLSLSTDGKTLAFSGSRKNELRAIYLLAVETLEIRQLIPPQAGTWGDHMPAISPDGKTVAFHRLTNAFQIYLVPAAGGEPRQVVSDSDWLRGLCWTADGNEILYGLQRPAGDALFRLPASGGAPVPLAGGEGGTWPAVSARGNHLAWVKRSINLDIWRFDSFGKQARAQPRGFDARRHRPANLRRRPADRLLFKPQRVVRNLGFQQRRHEPCASDGAGRAAFRHAALVAGWTADRVRFQRRGAAGDLRHQRQRRQTAPPDDRTCRRCLPELVARWPLDLLWFESQRRVASLEDARRRRRSHTSDPARRARSFGLTQWSIHLLRERAGPHESLARAGGGR